MGVSAIDLALVAAGVGLLAGARERRTPVAVAAAVAATVWLLVSCLVLVSALVSLDPSLRYVEQHASSPTPTVYRVAALWGGMEGSLLFWTFVVAAVPAVAAACRRRTARSEARLLAITSSAAVIVFGVVTRFRASPFDTVDVPTGGGAGLLGVLQHPAMVYHPPILYVGLAVTLPPGVITVAAIWQRRLDAAWVDSIRGWLLAAWTVLGLGILAGSQWAYAELGWGGLWAWDPVENASLLPWLALTAAVHTARVARSGRLVRTTAASVVAALLLVVSGVFVTRSGTTGSIHAFSESSEVAAPLGAVTILALVAGVATAVRLGLGELPRWTRGRPIFLGAAAVLSTVVLVIVAVGTYWPVIDLLGARDRARSIVAARYYERLLLPVAIVMLLLQGLQSVVRGGRLDGRRLTTAAVGSLLGLLLALWVGARPASELGVGAGAIAAAGGWAVGSAVHDVIAPKRAASALAHAGIALFVVAAVLSSSGLDTRATLSVGETRQVGDVSVTLVALRSGVADRFEYVEATVEVDDGGSLTTVSPELRAYEDQMVPTAEAAIDGSLSGDLIVVVESLSPDASAATIVVRTRPVMVWAWVGGVAVIAAGVIAFVRVARRGTGAGPRAASRTGSAAEPAPTGRAASQPAAAPTAGS